MFEFFIGTIGLIILFVWFAENAQSNERWWDNAEWFKDMDPNHVDKYF